MNLPDKQKTLHKAADRQNNAYLPDYAYSSELTKYRLKRENLAAVVLVLIWIAGAFGYEYCKINFIAFLLIVLCGTVCTILLFERFQYCPQCGRKIKCLDIKKDNISGFHIYYCPECKIKSKKEHYSDND